jgi:hypothetical protein
MLKVKNLKEAQRLEKNLGAVARRKDEHIKGKLMTMFVKDWEAVTGERLTIEIMRSPAWKKMQKDYVNLFMKGVRNDHPKNCQQ